MAFKRFFTTLLIFAGIAGIYSFARFADDPLVKIKQLLDKWANEEPVEKVYLHLDKPYYAAGEDIWFKAYVVSGSSHQLSVISRIVNIELIDERDSIKQSVKLPLIGGVANGDFALPDTLHQGNYRIRAYTSYMRNAGSNYFFNEAVTIVNTITAGKDPIAKKSAINRGAGKIDVQFFPEGGYLVNDITTKVAFKAVAPNGLGVDIKGTITDSKGQQVAQFTSTHLGMGQFEMTPRASVTYQAKITNANGSENISTQLKAIYRGYVLNIADYDARNLQVKITASGVLFMDDPNQQVTLVAQSAGKIYYSEKNKPGSAVFTSVIPKSKFPSGIVQFTLFSSV